MILEIPGVLNIAECKTLAVSMQDEVPVVMREDAALAVTVADRVRGRIDGFGRVYGKRWSRVVVSSPWKICRVVRETTVDTVLNERKDCSVAKLILFLTSNYDNGNIVSSDESCFKPAAGSVLLCDTSDSVSSLPVTWGNKYIAVSDVILPPPTLNCSPP